MGSTTKTVQALTEELKNLQESYDKLLKINRVSEQPHDEFSELMKSEMRFKELFRQVNGVSVQGYAPDGTTIYWNQSSEELYGYSADEAIGENLLNLIIPPEMRPGVKMAIEQMARTGVPIPSSELSLMRKDGSRVSVFSSHTIIQLPGCEQELYCVDVDLTEQKKVQNSLNEAKQELESNYSLLRLAGKIAKFGGWTVDVESNKSVWSDEVCAIHEMPAGYLPSVDEGINFYSEEWHEKITEVFTKCAIHGIPYDEEMEIVTRTGKRVWVRTTGEAVRDELGKIVKVTGAFQDITDYRYAKKELAKQNELMETLLENLQIGVFLVEAPSGKPLIANKTAKNLLGRGILPDVNKENMGEVYRAFRMGTGAPYPLQEMPIIMAINGIASYIDDMVVERPDGKQIELEVYGTPVKDKNGKVWASLVSFSDITQRKALERSLKESEEKFRSMANLLPQIVFETDAAGKLTYANCHARKILKFPDDFVMEGLNTLDLYTDESRIRAVENIQKRLSGSNPMSSNEYEMKCYDGSVIPVLVYSNPIISNGKPVGLRGLIIDISELRQAEEAVKKSKQLYDELVANIPVGVYILHTNAQGEFWLDYASPRMAQMIDISVETLLSNSESIFGAIHPDEREEFITLNSDGIRERKLFDWKGRIAVRDEVRWVHVTSRPQMLDDGDMLWHGLIVDITEQVIVETEIKEKNEMLQELIATKDKFFSIIAHDLRSPFNYFLGLTQLMAEQLPTLTMSQMQEIAGGLQKSALNLYRLLDNLLKWSQIQRGVLKIEPKDVMLNPFIVENVEMKNESAKSKEISVTTHIPENLCVHVDLNMLQTIIRNLLSNAIKFTPKGGSVHLSAQGSNADNSVLIAIRDTGIGMTDETISKLFKIDEETTREGTDNEPGTGLGLVLCKEFVEKNNGKIWVESRVDKGSTFYVELPASGAGVLLVNAR
jgi:PAS domain S-box-containing protein